MRTLTSIITFAAVLAWTEHAGAQCTIALPYWPSDSAMIQDLCPSASMSYAALLNLLETDAWDPLGASLTCSSVDLTNRMLATGRMLDEVTWANSTSTLDLNPYNWLLTHVAMHSERGYVMTCEDWPIATHHSAGPTELHKPFWEASTPIERAGILVHESAHEWSSHLSDDSCSAGGSCDSYFGESNASTWEVDFLSYGITSYVREPASDELQVFALGNDMCGYKPLLSGYHRAQARARMRSLLMYFFQTESPYSEWPLAAKALEDDPKWDWGGVNYQVDHHHATRWPCGEVCNPDDYDWSKAGKHACDPALQPGNAQVNADNLAKCSFANSAVVGGVTQQEWQQAASWFAYNEEDCVPGYSDAYLALYCDDLGAAAASVGELDASWQLDDQPTFDAELALAACERRYCDARFDATWVLPAENACYEWDDGIGCLDAVCGDLTAIAASAGSSGQQYFDAVNCRRNYIEHHGNALAYWTDEETQGKCEHDYVTCVDAGLHDDWLAARQAGTCNLVPARGSVMKGDYQREAISSIPDLDYAAFIATYPGVLVDACVQAKELCEALEDAVARTASKLIATKYVVTALASRLDLPDPPPDVALLTTAHEQVRTMASISAGTVVSGSVSPAQAVHALAATPQSAFVMQDLLGPATYFGAFGTSGRERVFGATALDAYAGASVCGSCGKTFEQTLALRALQADAGVRVRAESARTQALMATAQSVLSQQTCYALTRQLALASTTGEVSQVLDELERSVGGMTP